ncbi:MAG: hypothetical protein ACTIJ9_00190 [Aequorivita sp.]
MTYKEFIEENTEAANKVDITKLQNVYTILEGQKIKLDSATMPEERKEVIDFCIICIKENKQRLRTHFTRQHPIKGPWYGAPPVTLRLLNEYTDLYNRANGIQEDEINAKKDNPYPEIFPDNFSFWLFESLHETYKDSDNQLADYSFIYRKMWDLGHILEYQKPEMFRKWIRKEPYNIILGDKFKTLDRCTTASKENNFNLTFDLVEKL